MGQVFWNFDCFKLSFNLFSISSFAPGGLFVDVLATRSNLDLKRVYTYCCHCFFLKAVHMKIVFPLFFHLTGEKIFPCVHIWNISLAGRYLFWQALRRENFKGNQYSKWLAQAWRNTDQFCCICCISYVLWEFCIY